MQYSLVYLIVLTAHDSIMSEDDFLWNCAIVDPHRLPGHMDRQWIIPNHAQDLFLGRQLGDDYSSFYQSFSIPTSAPTATDATTTVSSTPIQRHWEVVVCEEHGQGVCDVIGGEVWEAALLLSAYLMLERHDLHHLPSILELGSGVGLPMLLLGHVRWQYQQGSEAAVGSLTMTDYDVQLVHNLSHAIHTQFPASNPSTETTESSEHDKIELKVNIAQLDWERFCKVSHDLNGNTKSLQCKDSVEEDIENIEQEEDDFMGDSDEEDINFDPKIHTNLYRDQFDIIIGSALCYASYHATCLADLIRYYLHPESRCKEVIIIQIKDREGFQTLIQMLAKNNEVSFEISRMSSDIIDYCQVIQRSLSSDIIPEDENLHLFTYLFPNSSPNDNHIQQPHLHKGMKWNMLQTSPEAFVLLRIFKKNSKKN